MTIYKNKANAITKSFSVSSADVSKGIQFIKTEKQVVDKLKQRKSEFEDKLAYLCVMRKELAKLIGYAPKKGEQLVSNDDVDYPESEYLEYYPYDEQDEKELYGNKPLTNLIVAQQQHKANQMSVAAMKRKFNNLSSMCQVLESRIRRFNAMIANLSETSNRKIELDYQDIQSLGF